MVEITARPDAVTATRIPARHGRAPRYKLAVVTWLCVYPMITVILASFKPLGLMALPLALRTLLLTLVMVPVVSFVLAPLVSRALARWPRR